MTERDGEERFDFDAARLVVEVAVPFLRTCLLGELKLRSGFEFDGTNGNFCRRQIGLAGGTFGVLNRTAQHEVDEGPVPK